jgi:Bacterial PH domain
VAHSVAVTAASVPQQPSVAPPTVIARAQKAQKIALASAFGVVVVFTAVAFTLRGKTESGRSYFHTEDQIAMTILGLLAAVVIMCFTRPRIVADSAGVHMRNLFGWIDIPWEIVTAVRFDRGNPWASIDLRDDDVISVMAIQAADKEYAVTAVRGLRALLAAHQSAARTPAPTD